MNNHEVIDEETGEVTAIAVREENVPVMLSADPVQNFRMMRALISEVADHCVGPAFRVNIQGKQYPTVNLWTTLGAALGMFPYEVRSEEIKDEDGNVAYESFVEVRRNGVAITSASAICSRGEKTWAGRDAYALKSMATTRATAKAYRLGLSFLAVLAGLEATPAEEMPRDGGSAPRSSTTNGSPGRRSLSNAKTCPEHKMPWVQTKRGTNAHPIKDESGTLLGWCDQLEYEAREMQSPAGDVTDPSELPWEVEPARKDAPH